MLPDHLNLDAPPLARCSRCGRSTWSHEQINTEDRMTQPDGGPCGGTFERIRPTPKRAPFYGGRDEDGM